MNIYTTPTKYSYYKNNQLVNSTKNKEKANITNFGKKNTQGKQLKINNIRNIILGGILALNLPQCIPIERYSKVEERENIKIEYFNVKKETMDSITEPLFELKAKLTPKNDFLSGISIDVAKKYEDLDDNDSFRRYIKERKYNRNNKGCSFYSDRLLQRKIAIQEAGHRDDQIINAIKNNNYSAIPFLHQTLMHEVGHQFDEYFGHNHNAQYAKKWDSIMAKYENDSTLNPYVTPEKLDEKKAMVLYDWNNTLSDKKEFQNAILKDIRYIATLNQQDKDMLAKNIEYYLEHIDLKKEITEETIDLLNKNRSEVYANLFSYALGEDDGEKAKFTENFKNSYEIVKKDIKKYLKIDIK